MKYSVGKFFLFNVICMLLLGCETLPILSSESSSTSASKRISASDTVIYTNVVRRLQNIQRDINDRVRVVVLKGRVLIVGYVDSPDEHLKITNVLWGVSGVQEVIDHLEYVKEESQKNGFSFSYALIKAQLDAKLLTQRSLSYAHFQYVIFKDNLYVLACPLTEAEKDMFFSVVRKTPQIKKVFFYDMHR